MCEKFKKSCLSFLEWIVSVFTDKSSFYKIKKEKEDFKRLYEGITNKTVKERIRASGEWYIASAVKYKRYFFILSTIAIVAPLLITVVNSMGTGDAENAMKIRISTARYSVLASFASTFLVVSKCKEKWTSYRMTLERIKSALVLYSIDEGDDEERLKRLVTRTERIMKEEHDKWQEILEDDDQENVKKRKTDPGEKEKKGEQEEKSEKNGE